MPINYPYPISGFWIFSQPPGQWGVTLDAICGFGANKVLQFGPTLLWQTECEIKHKEPFQNLFIGRTHAFDAIKDDIEQLNSEASIRHIYTLDTNEVFADTDMLAKPFDKKVVISNDIYWILVFSATDPKAKIDLTESQYDIILIRGKTVDSVAELLGEANSRSVDVYIGMPLAPGNPWRTWEAWEETKPIFFELLKRILSSYKREHLKHKSFAGFYQSFEIQVSDAPVASVLTLYTEQHTLVRNILPNKKIVISPYWDARKLNGGHQSNSVKQGFIKIAETGVDIIAPQDGRGTGKVGLFWPHQAGDPVPKELHPAVGLSPKTYGDAYFASSRDFYSVCRDAIDKLFKGRVELWANIEAFEPGKGVICATWLPNSQRTTKNRLDLALTFVGTHCSEHISFMWSDLYECLGKFSQPLKKEIQDDWHRPIVVEAFRWSPGNKDGLIVRGYGIAQGYIRLSFYDSSFQKTSTTVPVSNGWVSPDFGKDFNAQQQEKRYHIRLQEIWIPFPWTNMAPNFWLHIEGINGSYVSNHKFSLKY
jgi:hypothetical protein